MKKRAVLCLAAFVFAAVLLCHRLYMPRNAAYGVVHRGANEYVLPEDTLDSLLSHLKMTFALEDSPSCGFDESYMITLWDAEHQLQPVEKGFRQAADASRLKRTCIGNVIFL